MASYISWSVEIVLLLAVLRFVWSIVANLFVSPLRMFPGPWLCAISNIPYVVAQLKGTPHVMLQRLHEQYGPEVRFAPNRISSIKGSLYPEVYGPRPGKAELFKADTSERLAGAPGIVDAPYAQHRRYRRMLTHAFSPQGLREQEKTLQHYVDLLIKQLTMASKQGDQDISRWLYWTTFDLIGKLAFGDDFACLETTTTHPWISGIIEALPMVIYTSTATKYLPVKLIFLLVPKKMLERWIESAKLTALWTQRRIQLGSNRGDFMDQVLKHEILPENVDPQDPNLKGLTTKEFTSCVSDLTLAGSETSATALSGAVFYLLQHPACLKRVTEEVRASFATDASITMSTTTASKLPYLTAVLQETLRIYNPAPLMPHRIINAGGDVISGRFLPEDTIIGVSQHVACNSAYNFTRPSDFVPERWLGGSMHSAEFKNDNRENVYQPFSVGPRNCIGSMLANAEMRLILSKLLWNFDLTKPENAGSGWDSWIDDQKIFLLRWKGPLMVSVKAR
jgi:averantin hydroxylase